MPFIGFSSETRTFRFLRSLRGNALLAYLISVASVVLAVLIRFAIGEDTLPGVPFITFYPVIIFATLAGGFGPGLLAVLLSSAAAWYFFLPPAHSWELGPQEALSLVVFLIINAINIGIVTMLNRALERIIAREQEVRALIESAPNGIVVVDDQGLVRLVNASAEKLFGYTRRELVGKDVEVLIPDRLVDAHKMLRHAYMAAPETRAMGVGRDLNARRKDGTDFPVEIGLNSISRDGQQMILATVLDISERRKAAEQQRLVVNEMRHRTQNLFAIVHSIATRSLDEKRSIPEAKSLLLDRIQTLARAHAMLADAAWQGAPLDAIVRQTLDAFTSRATITGCDIVITPSAAQHFALILHELATNASKYGALSVPDGRISIEGTINGGGGERVFSFRWQESGGPPAARPLRRGFGSSVLVDAAKGFGERATLDYAPEGVSYELCVSLNKIQAIAAPNEIARPPIGLV
jgi:PAS domain S-box-containing protein